MAKDRFVEVYSQGVANVEKIIVDTETGVNYVLASSSLTVGCGMSVLLDADGKPVVTPPHKLNRFPACLHFKTNRNLLFCCLRKI